LEESAHEKVGVSMLEVSEKKMGQRIGQLEGAILRGLKAVSDRVAAALLEKADTMDLNDFRMQVSNQFSTTQAYSPHLPIDKTNTVLISVSVALDN
jgi:hypothetical protein